MTATHNKTVYVTSEGEAKAEAKIAILTLSRLTCIVCAEAA